MTPSQLNQAVSQATGEDLKVIARRGFSLVTEELPDEDPDCPLFIDWDQHHADWTVALFPDPRPGGRSSRILV